MTYDELLKRMRAAPDPVSSAFVPSSSLIATKTADFVGRRQIVLEIDDFLRERENGYYLLQALPGMGKSSLTAELVRRNGWPHHFNERAAGTGTISAFSRNVCAQLIVTFDLVPRTLPYQVEDAALVLSMLEEAAAKGEPVVIVVDGLDEVSDDAPGQGRNPLALPKVLPQHTFVILTSRPAAPGLIRTDTAYETRTLDPDDPDNQADVREYIGAWCEREPVVAYLQRQGIQPSTLAGILEQRSEYNFMYLACVLPEVARGGYSHVDPDRLPQGLLNYYEDHWRRLSADTDDKWDSVILPVLAAIAMAGQPLDSATVSALSGVTPTSRVTRALERLRPFLVCEPDGETLRYRIYHDTFAEFLRTKEAVDDWSRASSRVADQVAERVERLFRMIDSGEEAN